MMSPNVHDKKVIYALRLKIAFKNQYDFAIFHVFQNDSQQEKKS